MKNFFVTIVVIIILALGAWYFFGMKDKTETPTDTNGTATSTNTTLPQAYSSAGEGFSIRLPAGYTVDESHVYQATPTKKFAGVKFTIPLAMATGTNLGRDTYISVERLATTSIASTASSTAATCTGSKFFDGTHANQTITQNGVTYSVASSSGAGAGNRYEETVYALANSNPCVAVRYFIHYSVFENYPAGSIVEFNKQAILDQFDQIRKTLVVLK